MAAGPGRTAGARGLSQHPPQAGSHSIELQEGPTSTHPGDQSETPARKLHCFKKRTRRGRCQSGTGRPKAGAQHSSHGQVLCRGLSSTQRERSERKVNWESGNQHLGEQSTGHMKDGKAGMGGR